MNPIFTTGLQSAEVSSCNLCWGIDGRFDSECEEEHDDDFVLRFSTDESDSETTCTSSNIDYSSNTLSDESTCQHNEVSRLEGRVESTTRLTLLNCDNKVSRTCKTRRRGKKMLASMQNQRSVIDYFSRSEKSDEIKTDQNFEEVVNVRNLLDQLLTARVILERMPISITVKNDVMKFNDENKVKLQRVNEYCPTCDKAVVSRDKETCRDCKSFLKYECSKCGNGYTLRNSLLKHQRYKCFQETEEYQCYECKFSSSFKSSVQRHVRNVHTIENGKILNVRLRRK